MRLDELAPYAAILTLNGFAIALAATGRLDLLIHPRYTALVVVTSVITAAIAVAGVVAAIAAGARRRRGGERRRRPPLTPRQALFGLPVVAIVLAAVTIGPRPVSSTASGEATLTQGGTDLGLSRGAPPALAGVDTTGLTLADWFEIARFGDAEGVAGKPVDVVGFVRVVADQPPGTYYVARNYISCCAADSRLVGLLVEGEAPAPERSWIRVEGEIAPHRSGDRAEVVVIPDAVAGVPEPESPYLH